MTKKNHIHMLSSDGKLPIYANLYEPENPKAVVQILHGMAEHKERYDEMCNVLAKLGFVVIIADHRGHGESFSEDIPLGYFADENGWIVNLRDQNMFSQAVKEKYRRLPFFILGHSMGSLFACSYLKRYEDVMDGMILSGMPAYNKAVPAGKNLCGIVCKTKGKKGHSNLVRNMAEGGYIKTIKNPKTPYDWISYNEENVAAYAQDPLCGFPFTNKGYADLMDGMMDVFAREDWRVLKPQLPILFIAGQDDPCADVPKGFENSVNTLMKAGYENIEAQVYENMRHEVFNEQQRAIVYKDFVSWLNNQLKKKQEAAEEKPAAPSQPEEAQQ